MNELVMFIVGVSLGYGFRICYWAVTGRDIPLLKRKPEVARLRIEADRIERERGKA